MEMSLPISRSIDAKPNDNSSLVLTTSEQQQQLYGAELAAGSNISKNTVVSSLRRSKVEESDEELFTVPDVEAQAPATADSTTTSPTNLKLASNINNPSAACNTNNQQVQPEKRRRGRNPVDKEYRRIKRLLRNRVSAQQARERKKVYVSDLESRATELQDRNAKLEEKISTLINENTMLRKVLMNTRPKVDESNEPM